MLFVSMDFESSRSPNQGSLSGLATVTPCPLLQAPVIRAPTKVSAILQCPLINRFSVMGPSAKGPGFGLGLRELFDTTIAALVFSYRLARTGTRFWLLWKTGHPVCLNYQCTLSVQQPLQNFPVKALKSSKTFCRDFGFTA